MGEQERNEKKSSGLRILRIVLFIFYYLLQWSWGIIQNVAGLAVFIACIRCRHYFYHGSIVTVWKAKSNCMGLGMFIFLCEDAVTLPRHAGIVVHEYGHTIQSAILGPFFFLAIGIPSALWNNIPKFKTMRRTKNISYYRFYPERWANYLGEKITKETAVH